MLLVNNNYLSFTFYMYILTSLQTDITEEVMEGRGVLNDFVNPRNSKIHNLPIKRPKIE